MKASRSLRSILVTALGLGLVCSLPTLSMARVKGVCANCHTMHASQLNNGIGAFSNGTQTPNGVLLVNNCYGCHGGDGTARLDGTTGAPLVIVSGAPTYNTLLPGGFLLKGADEKTQHSIPDIAGMAAGLTYPPGWVDGGENGRGATQWNTTTLVCGGTNGCHGDPTQADQAKSVSGIHHKATALGYRGLKGISGAESVSYNVEHNGYSGIAHLGDANNTNTISSLCAQCHEDFHNLAAGAGDVLNASGAWIRHPTDFALDSANLTNDAYTSMARNIQVPIGKVFAGAGMNLEINSTEAADFDAWPTTVNGVVICLSCHRAHGSPYNDLLRWTYEGMVASTTGNQAGEGCFRCHSTKDGV